jgi:acyl carrier protein
MKNKYKDTFEEIFKKVMGLDSISDDMEMNDIAEWDSLKQVQLIVELEEKLNLDFEFEDIISMTSIKKIDQVLCKF